MDTAHHKRREANEKVMESNATRLRCFQWPGKAKTALIHRALPGYKTVYRAGASCPHSVSRTRFVLVSVPTGFSTAPPVGELHVDLGRYRALRSLLPSRPMPLFLTPSLL